MAERTWMTEKSERIQKAPEALADLKNPYGAMCLSLHG